MPSSVVNLSIVLQTFIIYFAISTLFLAAHTYSSKLLLSVYATASDISRDNGISIEIELSCPSCNGL